MNALTKAARSVIDRPVEEVIGEIVIRHKLSMSRLEKMLRSLPAGRTKLQVIMAMERLANEHTQLMMDMGALSRAAQLSTVTSYQFKASVGLLPPTNRSVGMFEAPARTIAGELTDGS
jgi:hypothetical protein